jgi:chemotaxis protein CheD
MEQNSLELPTYFLRPGYLFVPGGPTLISAVLGSCVAVSLWDTKREYGGMNHFLYPRIRDPRRATVQYGNIATQTLLRLFLETGSRLEDLEAQILGGAAPGIEGSTTVDIARQNIQVARQTMQRRGISIVSEDVGGAKGRKVIYNSQTNELIVVRVERLRKSDWYPYEGER